MTFALALLAPEEPPFNWSRDSIVLTNQGAENARALVDNALCSNSNHGINNERHNTET